REAEARDEIRQQVELLDDRVLELAPGLIRGQRRVAVGRLVERVPRDEHSCGLLGVPEPQQEVREPEHRILRDRLRQCVVGAVRERVAVDREQRAHVDTLSATSFCFAAGAVWIEAAPPWTTFSRTLFPSPNSSEISVPFGSALSFLRVKPITLRF